MPKIDENSPDAFVSLSVALTGFTHQELAATGSASTYRSWLESAFPSLFAALLELWQELERDSPDRLSLERALHREILADPRLGPFARNLALLWYTASWTAMPLSWSSAYGQPAASDRVFTFAYPEGLVWKAAGTHPIGANPTGFGSWALPPTPPQSGSPE